MKTADDMKQVLPAAAEVVALVPIRIRVLYRPGVAVAASNSRKDWDGMANSCQLSAVSCQLHLTAAPRSDDESQ